ncbi:MAG: DNA polymerase III subunit gamma/tau [Firmicutes bacterium]|nr:DNA polymerase III subunit gamma/tau [Bacillota bacterium]
MTYQALYRQWRPQTFAELVGQEHVARTLQNALQQGRLAHAYLFCGPRGTGKTSAAKILAKAVNCEQNPTREPCNQCPACVGVQAGRVMDVLEIDAASNRGIDEIRELREKTRYAPVEVRCKVYIIDEVHMLTAEAFNALLKTLEEPPPQVLFILATTEPHKLPATIISRCQRLDFHLLSLDEIVTRLRKVVSTVGRECSEQALLLVAEEAAGGLRDALSLLEQVLSYTSTAVTEEDVLTVLGAVSRDVFHDLTDAVVNQNLSRALLLLQDVASAGKEFHHFTQQAIVYYRNLMVSLACEKDGATLGIAEEWASRLYDQAQRLGLGEIGRILSILHELLAEVRWSARPRLLWELAVFRMFGYDGTCQVAPPQPQATLSATARQTVGQPEKPVKLPMGTNEPVLVKEVSPDFDADQNIAQLWPRLLEQVKKESVKTHALLLSGELGSFNGKVLEIHFSSQFHCDMMEDEHKKAISKVFQRLAGVQPQIRCFLQGQATPQDSVEKDPHELIHSAVEIFRGQIIDESDKQ